MCYTGGPRCANHVGKELAQAKESLAKLQQNKSNEDAIMTQYIHVEKLQREYYSTPTGQKELEVKIDQALSDGDMATADHLEMHKHFASLLRKNDMEARRKRLEKEGLEANQSSCDSIDPHGGVERDHINAEDRRIARKEQRQTASADKNTALVTPQATTVKYSDYDSSLTPQANDINKISSMVAVVNNGANSSNAIGETLALSDRQGHYYANAGVYIGLLEKHESAYEGGGHEYALTENGRIVLESPEEERAEHIRNMVNATPLMQTYHESGRDEEAVRDQMREMGLADGSIERRVSTVVQWDKTINNSNFVKNLASTHDVASKRSIIVARKLEEARAEKKLKEAKAAEDRGGYCPIHGSMRSPEGKCFDCEEESY